MTTILCAILLQFVTILAPGQLTHQAKLLGVSERPEAMVQSFYNEVVARHPVGIPDRTDMKTFAPYLSSSLVHTIDLARTCEGDYYRRHKNSTDKPPFDWLEFGLFTGADERVSPRTFYIERTEPEKDGSYRVYTRLTWGPSSKPWIWHVAVIVVRENGRFVVNDVIFLKDETIDSEFRLSKYLTEGCDDGHWVGYGKQRSNLK